MECKEVKINWKLTIKNAYLPGAGGGRFFLGDNKDIIMVYDQYDGYFHEKSKCILIRNGKISELYETREYLCEPLLVQNEEVFLTTFGAIDAETSDSPPSKIIKLDIYGKVAWEYLLEADQNCLPIYYDNSIFIHDFWTSKKSGNLYRIDKMGNLAWKKRFPGSFWSSPLVLEEKQQLVIGNNGSLLMYVLDLDGNILSQKSLGKSCGSRRVFSRGLNGEIFVNVNNTLIAFNKNTNEIWTYAAEEKSIIVAPIIDFEGNLYLITTWKKLVCLDSRGKERWKIPISGDIFLEPAILDNGNIFVASSGLNEKHRETTFIQIFSPQGALLTKIELNGYYVHNTPAQDGIIYVATNNGNKSKSIKLFELAIS
jgi:outer membrane protein assembly factor BamB